MANLVKRNFTIGPLDFDHDLQILGMSQMQQPAKLSYRIESESELFDELLAARWDLNPQQSNGEQTFRIIVSLEIKTTTNFEINFIAQAATCQEELNLEDYRHQYLNYATRLQPTDSLETSFVLDSFQTPNATHHPELHNLTATSTLDTPSNVNSAVKHLPSESGSSRPLSRFSHSTMASSRATGTRLQGFFQKEIRNSTTDDVPKCPFPNEWQFGTVPEVITNDEDID